MMTSNNIGTKTQAGCYNQTPSNHHLVTKHLLIFANHHQLAWNPCTVPLSLSVVWAPGVYSLTPMRFLLGILSGDIKTVTYVRPTETLHWMFWRQSLWLHSKTLDRTLSYSTIFVTLDCICQHTPLVSFIFKFDFFSENITVKLFIS